MAESDPRPRRWPYLLATALAVLGWRLLMLLAGHFDRSDLVAFPGLGALLLPAALLVIALLLGRRRGRDYAGVFGMIAVVVAIIAVGDVLEGGNPLDYLVWGPLALLLFLGADPDRALHRRQSRSGAQRGPAGDRRVPPLRRRGDRRHRGAPGAGRIGRRALPACAQPL